jgi:hypothetical protein
MKDSNSLDLSFCQLANGENKLTSILVNNSHMAGMGREVAS